MTAELVGRHAMTLPARTYWCITDGVFLWHNPLSM